MMTPPKPRIFKNKLGSWEVIYPYPLTPTCHTTWNLALENVKTYWYFYRLRNL